MIITQLFGGLGNQLFQYAIGRALAVKRGTTLKLDTLKLGKDSLRTYALNHFAIEAAELTPQEYRELGLPSVPKSRVQRLIARIFDFSSMPIIREQGFAFDPSALDAPAHCYLRGYWQSPKYFASIESSIRRELGYRNALTGANLDAADDISRSPAVSVHVRRGDYAASATTNQYHGTCDLEYYLAAEALLCRKVGEPRLFIFSDDPDWVEKNLHFESPTTIVRHNGPERHYEDLRLMTLCKHHIIANSTFSWWSAWLCANPGKIVVAPRNWFRDAGHSTADLIPEDWIRV
jgi:hypothetical protein